jgi:hypothetical protein
VRFAYVTILQIEGRKRMSYVRQRYSLHRTVDSELLSTAAGK